MSTGDDHQSSTAAGDASTARTARHRRAGRSIGQLAKAAAVNVETVRFYEREGLIERPTKLAGSGWRRYDDEALTTIVFIKRAQRLGFSLAEIRQLLTLRRNDSVRCDDVRRTAELKLAEVDKKIRDLSAMRAALATLVARCCGQSATLDGATLDGTTLSCPIIESLAAPDAGADTPG